MKTTHASKWLEGVSPDDHVVDAAVFALCNRLEAVQHYLPLAAKEADEDVEYVHQLRVWTRRASAALKLYEEYLPHRRLAWMKKQLKRIRRVANDARDCDVQIQRLIREDAEEVAWIEKLRAERAKAQRPLRDIWKRMGEGNRLQRRCTRLVNRVRIRTTHEAHPLAERFGDWARARLQRLVNRFFDAAPPDNTDEKQLGMMRNVGGTRAGSTVGPGGQTQFDRAGSWSRVNH